MEHIKKKLRDIENNQIKENAIAYFPMLHDSINQIFDKIPLCARVEQADDHFNLLHEIHFVLAKFAFQERIPLPKELIKFIIDFDRIDDKEWRDYLFNKIKNKQYSLAGEPALYERSPGK